MLAAVEFDYQSCFQAGEVGDVSGNRVLAAKALVGELVFAQMKPESMLGIGHVAAELSREIGSCFLAHGPGAFAAMVQNAGWRGPGWFASKAKIAPSALRAAPPLCRGAKAGGETGWVNKLSLPPAWRGKVVKPDGGAFHFERVGYTRRAPPQSCGQLPRCAGERKRGLSPAFKCGFQNGLKHPLCAKQHVIIPKAKDLETRLANRRFTYCVTE